MWFWNRLSEARYRRGIEGPCRWLCALWSSAILRQSGKKTSDKTIIFAQNLRRRSSSRCCPLDCRNVPKTCVYVTMAEMWRPKSIPSRQPSLKWAKFLHIKLREWWREFEGFSVGFICSSKGMLIDGRTLKSHKEFESGSRRPEIWWHGSVLLATNA